MGNTECQCIATHHNQKILEIYHPTIQQHPNKTKNPNQPHFDIFPCSDVNKDPTQPYKDQSESKVSVYQLDEPSIELHQKNYKQDHLKNNYFPTPNNNPGQKQNILGYKDNHPKGNGKKQSSLHLNQVNRRASSRVHRSSQHDNKPEETNNKITLRERVNKDTQKIKQNSAILQVDSPVHVPPLQLQTDYSFIESSMDTSKQPTFKVLSFQKGVTLRQEYDFKKMLEKNLINLKEKLKLWPEITNQQSFLTNQHKFYFHPDLFSPKHTQKQKIYKIVLQKHSPSLQTNRSSLNNTQKITKYYRGSVKSITNPRDQTSQSLLFLDGLGEEYCIANDNYSQFTYFNGNYKDNQFQGNGLFIHADLDYYVGEWLNSKAHGHGTFQHYEGMRYQGSWKCDQQHGEGQEFWEDGAIFRGKFFHGYKIYGEFQWPNGTSYLGQFNENRLQGKGKFSYEDDRYYYGEWKDNMMHGYGEFKWKNGQHFKGNYEFDKKHGNGTLILGDGTVIEAKWIEGKIHGKGKVTKKNGDVRIVEWNMGVEIRPSTISKK